MEVEPGREVTADEGGEVVEVVDEAADFAGTDRELLKHSEGIVGRRKKGLLVGG